MSKKHIVGYGLTALGCLGIGLAGSSDGAPATATVSTETVTVTASAAAPTPAEATVTVTAPGSTETHTVTEAAEAETVTETVEAEAVTETVTVTAAAEAPGPAAVIPGDGTFEVGVDIDPGTYVSSPTSGIGCYWARLSGSDGFDSIITNDFGTGQMIATVQESDRFFETSGCEPWAMRE